MLGSPMVTGMAPRTLAPGSGSKMDTYHVDQHEKLKGLGTVL